MGTVEQLRFRRRPWRGNALHLNIANFTMVTHSEDEICTVYTYYISIIIIWRIVYSENMIVTTLFSHYFNI